MRKRLRLSPVLLLANVLVLGALVAGTALAGPSVAPSTQKKAAKHADAKADGKQFNALLKAAAPNLSVKSATSATNATHATHATAADTATSAQPTAFARVDGSTGHVDNAKGVTNANVTHPATGVYCVSGLAFTVMGAQVTTQFEGTNATTGQFSAGTTGNCPHGGQVLTWKADGTAGLDQTFYIVLYG